MQDIALFDLPKDCGYRRHPRTSANLCRQEADSRMLTGDFLRNSAIRAPDRVALIGRGQRLTYAQFDEQANLISVNLFGNIVTSEELLDLYPTPCDAARALITGKRV